MRASRTRWVVLLLATLVFIGAGMFIFAIAPGSRAGAALMALFAGLCAALACVRIAAPSRLTLSPQGVTTSSLGGGATRSWADVQSCIVVPAVRTRALVALQLKPGITPKTAVSAAIGDIVGDGVVVLPDTYGLSASDLADLLNRWRARYGGATP